MACRTVVAAAISFIALTACASPDPLRAGPSDIEARQVQPLPPPCRHDRTADSRDPSDNRCTVKTAWWQTPGGALEGAALAAKFRLP
jgi:hypothetical protein